MKPGFAPGAHTDDIFGNVSVANLPGSSDILSAPTRQPKPGQTLPALSEAKGCPRSHGDSRARGLRQHKEQRGDRRPFLLSSSVVESTMESYTHHTQSSRVPPWSQFTDLVASEAKRAPSTDASRPPTLLYLSLSCLPYDDSMP